MVMAVTMGMIVFMAVVVPVMVMPMRLGAMVRMTMAMMGRVAVAMSVIVPMLVMIAMLMTAVLSIAVRGGPLDRRFGGLGLPRGRQNGSAHVEPFFDDAVTGRKNACGRIERDQRLAHGGPPPRRDRSC